MILEESYEQKARKLRAKGAYTGVVGKMSFAIDDIQVKKSNPLIQAMGTPSTLANQLLYTALVHVEKADPKYPSPKISKEDWKRIKENTNADYTKGLVAIFPQSEVRKYSGRSNSGSYYLGLDEILNTSPKSSAEGYKALSNQWEIILNSRGVHEHVSLITASAYDEVTKTVLIKFSDEEKVQKQIFNLQKNYTTLSYEMMMKFKSNYASKLYEILKSRIDYEDKKEGVIKSVYEYKYNLAHLKFMLGVLNPFYSNETIRMLEANNPDYSSVEQILNFKQKDKNKDKSKDKDKEAGWPKWYDFKRYCLDKCKKEINELTEFNIDYKEGDNKGRGGKVLEVIIIVSRKTEVVDTDTEKPVKTAKNLTDDEKDEFIDQLREIIKDNLKTKELRTIAEEAGYEIEKVETAYAAMEAYRANNPERVGSVVAYMRDAIRNNYKPGNKGKKTNSFNNFEQRADYDFKDLESRLLDN